MLIQFVTFDGACKTLDTDKLYEIAVFTQKPPTRKQYAEMQINLLEEKQRAGLIRNYKIIY